MHHNHSGEESPKRTLLLGFAVLIAVIVGLTFNDRVLKHQVMENLQHSNELRQEKLRLADQMNSAWRKRALLMVAMLHSDDPFERDESEMQHRSTATRYQVAREAYAEMPLDDTEQSLLRQLDRQSRERYAAQIQMLELLREERTDEAEEIFRSDVLDGHQIRGELLATLAEYAREQADKAYAESADELERLERNSLGLSIASIWLAIIIAIYVVGHTLRIHRQAQQARERARSADTAKSTFLANMSHEIRTPLNAINGMANLLEHTELDDTQSEYVQVLHTSSESLLGVINDILDFSKIEAGKLAIESEPYDLREAIHEALEIRGSAAFAKGLELGYHVDPAVPDTVIGDQTRLRQILVNLLGNAVKFTTQGAITIVVKLSDTEAGEGKHAWGDHSEIVIEVRDTGIGLSEEEQSRLFQRYSQASVSTSRQFGGTGLGLAISKHLIELMGGRIGVRSNSESENGHGSVFYLSLPIQASAQRLANAKRADRNPSIETLAGKQVLVLEPNAENRRTLRDCLSLWGAELQVLESPDQLATLDQSKNIDIALVDARWLPDRVHRNNTGAGRIVAMVAIGQPFDLSNTASAAQVTRPVRPARLKKTLEHLLSRETDTPLEPTRPTIDDKLAERHPLRILLAEDSEMNRMVARSMLSKLGYQIDTVENGQQAVLACETNDYDLLLMDIQMPVMDGVEATGRIKTEIEKARRPWIVAMTANALSGDRERFLKAGMDDYMAKPVEFRELMRVLSTTPRIAGSGGHFTANPEAKPEAKPEGAATHSATTPKPPSAPTSAPTSASTTPAPSPRSGASDAATIDSAALDHLRDLTHDGDISPFIELYLRDSRKWMSALRAQFSPEAKTDAAVVAANAHPLKSNSMQIGAASLASLAGQLEAAARKAELIGREALMLEIESAYESASRELRGLL